MNILFIYPKPDQLKKPRFGFSYEMLIFATIFSKYHNVYIKDFSCEYYDMNELVSFVIKKNIDIVFIECDSYALKRSQNILHAIDIMNALNKYAKIIAYGNYCYIKKINFSNATFTIVDNEVNKFIEYVNYLEGYNHIPYITKYDNLPYIDRNILLKIPYYKENKKNTLLQTSKGCENTCTFCQRKGWQSYYTAHSDYYVLNEIRELRKEGYQNIWIIDENFTFNLNRAKRLLKSIIKESLHENMNFFISSWTNIDKEFLDLAKNSNIKIISFGIESSNKEILKFYKKNIDIDSIPNIVQYANSIGIFTVGNFIIGAPMETEETIKETFSFIKKCEFDQVNIKNLDYMIGSNLYETLDEKLKEKDHIFACLENGLNNLKLNEIKNKKEKFLLEYYKLHRPLIEKKIRLYGMPF